MDREIFLRTTHLEFAIKRRRPKTVVLSVVSIRADEEIGTIGWHPAWRQYCLHPADGTMWDAGRLDDVNRVIGVLMSNRGEYATFQELSEKLDKIWAQHAADDENLKLTKR